MVNVRTDCEGYFVGYVMSVHEETNVKQYTTVVTMIVYQKE